MKPNKNLRLPNSANRQRHDLCNPLYLYVVRGLLLMMRMKMKERHTMWECHSGNPGNPSRRTMTTETFLGCPPNWPQPNTLCAL